MNPKVSILVPVYKVSEYIERCAESLFNQSFEDIEYIFVNDASPDDSIEKLKKTIDKYPRRKQAVRIIDHAENKGTASTRNTALDAATGEYIAAIDSDDYIEPEMIEVLYNTAIRKNADVVMTDYYIENPDGTVIHQEYFPGVQADLFDAFLRYDKFTTVLWNKLIRRTLYARAECRVPDGMNFMDDKHVFSRLLFYGTNIVKAEGVYYHYNNSNMISMTHTRNRMHFENIIRFWGIFDNFLKENNLTEKYQHFVDIQKIKSKANLMIGTDSDALRREFSTMFMEEEKAVLKYFIRGEKLMLLLIRNKLFPLAQLFHNLLIIKRNIKNRLKK